MDITPEYASKLGAAYGSTLKTNSRVAISCDDSSAAQMMKMSICSGIISSGAEIFDFGQMLIPVARSAIRFFNIDGGIHISACCNKNGRLCIDFLDSSGSSIDREAERKIETAFIREDFTRCECENLKPVRVISEYNNFYLRNITNNIKSPHFTSRLLINAPDGMAFNIMKRLMTELGCNADFIQKNQPDGSCTEEGIEEIGLKSLSDKVKRGKYDLGVFVEDGCEKMVLFDDKGRIITEDSFVALVSMILFKSIQGGTVYVPISVSSVIEKIADENNGRVIRTKTSHRDIMKSIFANEVKEEMLEQFTMHYDAMAGIVKILDFIELNGYKLSDLVNLIPDYHVNRQEVACPWNSKGRVIRQLK